MSEAGRVHPEEIRAALDEVLGSETFSRSERSRELLKYIVERDLDGESDRLKGFAIALDVFGREDSFDPSTDAVVRVQAGRLRGLLDTYYEGEGARDAVRITIPRGTYVPSYIRVFDVPPLDAITPPNERSQEPQVIAPPEAESDSGAAPAGAFVIGWRAFAAVAALLVILVVGVVILAVEDYSVEQTRLELEGELLASEENRVPVPSAIDALPSVAIDDDFPAPLRAAFENAIPRFGSVVYRSDKAVTLDHPLADFHMEAVPAGQGAYNIEVYHTKSGILVGSDHLAAGDAGTPDMDQVARILSRFLPSGGAIYSFLEGDGMLNPLTNCLVLGSAYFSHQNAGNHDAAYRCHEKLIASGLESSLSYSELATLTVEAVTDHYDYPKDATLKAAVTLARRAVELAPDSAIGHRALGRALLVSGERQAALDETRSAVELNPFDLGIAASYGNALIAHGDFAEALDVLRRAVTAAPVHPTWWDYATFLAAFEQGDRPLLEASARNLAGYDRAHYRAARLIAASLAGDDETREKMLAELAGDDSAIVRDPQSYYARLVPDDAAQRLADALRGAGFVARGDGGE